MRKILLLSPHPDDIEFGCGASIARWVREGHEIHLLIFSPCNRSMPVGFQENELYRESEKACQILGIDESNIVRHAFPVRDFPEQRQAILEKLIEYRKSYYPDLVVLPNSKDIHQDHQTIYQEGLRAFKHSSVIGYELPWNSLEFRSNYHSSVTKKDLNKKFKAIQQYKTQHHRPYFDEDFFTGLARMRGTQINQDFAEAFELIRWIE